jgi:hypothetical protein
MTRDKDYTGNQPRIIYMKTLTLSLPLPSLMRAREDRDAGCGAGMKYIG